MTRQSRFKPDPKRNKRMRLQRRDAEIIYELYQDQFLSTTQIMDLFFNHITACRVRLRKLFNQGYVKRAFAPVSFGSSEALYFPTKKGMEFAIKELNLDPSKITFRPASYKVQPEKQRHEIQVNQLKVSLIQAIRKNPEIELIFCRKDPNIWDIVKDPNPNPNEYQYIPIRPDRFICLKANNSFYYFFVEVDRGTMRLIEFRRKLRGYRIYYFEGGFLKKYGREGQKIEDLPFRILVTAPSEERRNNLVEQAILENLKSMALFTTFSQAEKDFLGPIWIRGKEYQEIIDNLSKEEQERIKKASNKRKERNRIIREKISFLSLF